MEYGWTYFFYSANILIVSIHFVPENQRRNIHCTVVLFFFAFQRGYSVLNDLFRSFTQIMEDNTFLNDFIAFLNLPGKTQLKGFSRPVFAEKEIRIENLSFSYETSKRNALNEINITIPRRKNRSCSGCQRFGKNNPR